MSSLLNALARRSAPPKSTIHILPDPDATLKILFAGEIKSGKSSLINALMDAKILPESISRHTAAIHYCRHGAEPSFTVHYRDEQLSPEVHPLTLTELSAFTDQAGSIVKFIVVEHPSIPVGVDLIDSPGINDSDPYRNSVVHTFMTDADALVFVFDATRTGSISELNFLRGILGSMNLSTCLFLGNKADLIASPERKVTAEKITRLLQKEVSGKIQGTQVRLIAARNPDADDVRPSVLVDWLGECLEQKSTLLTSRAEWSELRRLLKERGLLSSRQLMSDEVQGPKVIAQWRDRVDRVLKSVEALEKARTPAIRAFRDSISQELDHVAAASAKMMVGGATIQSQVQAEIQNLIIVAVEKAKATAAKVFGSIPSVQAAQVEVSGMLSTFDTSRQQILEDANSKASLVNAAFQSGALSMLHLSGLAGIAVMAAGNYYLTTVGQKATGDVEAHAVSLSRDQFKQIGETLIGEIERWCDDQLKAAEGGVEKLLHDLYVAFDPVEAGESADLNEEVKRMTSRIDHLQDKLGAG